MMRTLLLDRLAVNSKFFYPILKKMPALLHGSFVECHRLQVMIRRCFILRGNESEK